MLVTQALLPPTDKRGQAALQICSHLTAHGFRALLAGGCVRDLILKIPPNDYDIATNARCDDVVRLFQNTHCVGAAFGVSVVVRPEAAFEVATFRQDGPYGDGRHPDHVQFVDEEEDAKRRDFTINALFFDPISNAVLDYVNGLQDLRDGILRAVGEAEQRFCEDHLRLLRAIRFAARLGYAIAPDTYEAICKMAPLATKTSMERIRDELLKMLTEDQARRAFELLDKTGLLAPLLPEVAQMKGVAQPPQYHPEGDVFTHTLLMLNKMKSPSRVLALAVLLHDVGKPRTQTFEDRIRFNHHDKVGARMADAICRRLHIANNARTSIVWLVANHMRLAMAQRMRESKRKRLVRKPDFPNLLDLCRLDCQASHLDETLVDWVESYARNLNPEEVRPPRLLNGHDLIAMGFSPNPLFSEILCALEDAQLEGTVKTMEDARNFVHIHWDTNRNQ